MERFQYVISLRIPPSNNPRFESGGSFSIVIGRFDFPIHLQLGEKINIKDFYVQDLGSYTRKHPSLNSIVIEKNYTLKYSQDINQSFFEIEYVLECEDRDLMLEVTDEIDKIR